MRVQSQAVYYRTDERNGHNPHNYRPYLSECINVDEAGVVKITLSDHLMTYLLIKKQHTIYEKRTFVCRQLRNLDEERLVEEIEAVNWDIYYTMNDVNTCWQFIYDTLIMILDMLCPEKRFENIKKKSDWISLHLFELMYKRNLLFAGARKEPEKWDEAKKY